MNTVTPLLIGTIGSPGSGKSYFSEKISKDLHLVHLRSDDIRFRIISEPNFTQEEHNVVFGFMDFLAEKILDNKIGVIYDANLVKYEHRERLIRIAENTKAKFVMLWIKTPLDLAITRAKDRKFHPITKETVEAIAGELEEFRNEPHIIIDGIKSYEEQRDFILKGLRL